MDNNKLLQITLEDTYSRKNIHKLVKKDLMDSNFDHLFEIAKKQINAYKTKTYTYDSKIARVNKIKDMDSDELVLEILSSVGLAFKEEAQPIQSVAARIAYNLPYDNHLDAVKTASELLAVVCESNLFDILLPNTQNNAGIVVVSNFQLEPKTIKAIEMCKYLPPMVCEPNEITGKKNIDTSHMTISDSLILGDKNHHEDTLAIDVINIANSIPLSLDERMLEYEEVPNKPLDTPDKQTQFQKMATDSLQVYQEILDAGNRFFLTWRFDFRSRMYSQGYHINIQSTDYKKSLINLAHKEVITCD